MADSTEAASQSQEGAEGAKPEEPEVDWKAKYEDMRGHMREWQSRAESNKAKADAYDQFKESQLSETEKLTRRAEKAEKKLADMEKAGEITGWKNAASEKYGVPASLLSGDSAESIEANAKALAEWKNPKPTAPQVHGQGRQPSGTPANEAMRETVRRLFKKND